MREETLYVFAAASRDALAHAEPFCGDGPHRLAILAGDAADLAAKRERAMQLLRETKKPHFNSGNAIFYAHVEAPQKVAFLFPGYGAKHSGLLAEMHAQFPAVRAWMDSLSPRQQHCFRENEMLFPDAVQIENRLWQTLEAIVGSNLAMHALLGSFGIRCDAMAGHSYGENTMLVAAGVASSEDVIALLRGLARAMESPVATTNHQPSTTNSVAMLAVPFASLPAIAPPLHLALDNCPQQAVVCGPPNDIAALEAELRANGTVVFRVAGLDQPVHTPLLPVSDDTLRELCAPLELHAPQTHAYSCATAATLPEHAEALRTLIASQWKSTVRFRETVQRMYDDGIRLFVEVGAGDRLSGFVRDTLRGKDIVALSSHHESRSVRAQLQLLLAQLYVRGAVDARALQERWPKRDVVRETLAEVLGVTAESIDADTGFFDLGLTSIGALELVAQLETALGRKLPQTLPFDFPTLAALAAHLTDAPQQAAPRATTIAANEAIAIVGIGCRFPGNADSPDAFWQLLDEGRDAIVDVPRERWNPDDFGDMPRRGGFLREDVSRFDAAFFGISPREATTLDPQQRLLLEVTWEALEHAAIDPTSLAGTRTAVFTGISSNDYASRFTPQQRMQIRGYLGTGNTFSTAAGRISYVLGLMGPSMAVDTACSSSLVAVHLACRSLRSGESDVALAGGVNLLLSPENTFLLHRAQALSPDARCATFDESANGYVRGEGCGVVVLKRLSDAVEAGDDVLAVIRGSAVTHDGRTSGLMVPSGRSQQLVVREALRDAALEPRDVTYVEAHGTGTSLGDPIEVHALGDVFAKRATPLVVGALKTNIGHLESAAGIAGLIKVVLQLRHRRIAASLHCTTPSTKIDWERLPIAIANAPRAWDAERRIAGISSFGISGTNAHVIVEEAPQLAPIDDARNGVITLSAKSAAALRALEARFASIEKRASVAYTTNVGRAHFKHRKAIPLTPEWEPIAKRYEAGETIDWRALHANRKRRRVTLPTYPFERERYWIESDAFAIPPEPARIERNVETKPAIERLHDAAAHILDMPRGANLDPAQPFQQLGFDSLMAMELSNFVQTEYGVAIPAARIIGEHSLATLAAALPRRAERNDAVIATHKTEGPLSYGQRALWFLHALVPESSAYNQSIHVRVHGNAETIRARCKQLVQRHGAMRTIFPRVGEEPLQRVLDRMQLDFAIGDDDAQRRPFDLERGPLVRFRLDGDTLTIVMHHIICDGWSFELLARELRDASFAARPLEHTYLDSVDWEQRRLASDEGKRLREYWHRQLAAPRPLLALPTDRPRPAVQTMNGASIAFRIDTDLAAQLRDLARSSGATPFAAFLAPFLLLLRRYAQQDELLVGTPTAGRPRAELAPIVGYFVDVVVLRTHVREGQSFRDLLASTAATTQAALEHTGYPFALLVEELRVERDPSRSPLFDVLFNYLRREAVSEEVPQADGKFDLTLTILDGPTGTHASLGYNTDLYDRETIERFKDEYLEIAQTAVADPTKQILNPQSPILNPVIAGRSIDEPPAIHQMFEAQAATTPDAIAVVANGTSLTYRELNERADALARVLTPGIIPLCEPRTPELLVRLLAILKAGGAYLPLDPGHPESLRRTMIEEASRAPHHDLAYVIFTSGSTGKPKGVAVDHRAIANYVTSIIDDVAFPPRAHCAFVSTIAADLGQTVLFPALATGGTVHLVDDATATDGAAFARYVREQAIDVLKIVPSHLAALLDTGGAAVLPRQTLILGGEGVAPQFVARLHALAPQLRIFNHYGPTESTVGVLTREIVRGESLSTRTLPLRNAIAKAAIYLLDERGRAVARGAIGEVCIGGTPLARGYVNAPNDPFVTLANGTRVYRTGDLARITSNGDLELLGRRDRQLNIRGYRIEPAQVEAALRDCGIAQCAVLPNADGDAATHLVAYVTGERRDLTNELSQRLPRHMLPSSLMFVDRLPLTSNGKLDTHALRGLQSSGDARLPIRARDPIELQLARLWSDILRVAHVGIRDDFFALGGHSLLAVRLASRIEEELHVRVPLATFFTHRTIEQLATAIRERTPPSLLVPLQSKGAQPPLFCFPGAGGSVMYFSDLARHLGDARPIFGLQPPDDASLATVEALAALALPEIRKRASQQFLLAGHSFGALVAYEVARRLFLDHDAIAHVAVLDNAAPGAMAEHDYDAWSESDWLRHIGQRMEKLYGANLQLGDDLTADALIARMLDASLLPSGTNAANFRRFIAVYRANAMAAARYRPEAIALPIPITVFQASEHDAQLGNATTAGWSRYSSDVRVLDADGTHITMMTEPHVLKLARDLREVLVEPRASARGTLGGLKPAAPQVTSV